MVICRPIDRDFILPHRSAIFHAVGREYESAVLIRSCLRNDGPALPSAKMVKPDGSSIRGVAIDKKLTGDVMRRVTAERVVATTGHQT
jgi:hypothetical protein